jgi:short subunit dehydrogenase-like uncharacterized protein
LSPLAKQGGSLTPATALGNVLVERLEKWVPRILLSIEQFLFGLD